MKKIAVIALTTLALALALAGAARAQVPAASAVAAAAPAPAPAPVDPAALKAARELFESMNYRQSMAEMMRQMAQGAMQTMRPMVEAAVREDKRLSAAQRKQVVDKVQEKMPQLQQMMVEFMADPKLADELLEQSIPIYARNFTVEEIQQLAAFYRSPIGAKMLTTMPKLAAEGMQASQALMVQRMQPMMQKMLTILKD